MLSGELSTMDLQLISIEHNFLCTLLDLERDLDSAFILPITARFEVVKREEVIGRLNPMSFT